MQKSWWGAAYRLVLNGLLSLLSYGIQDSHQRMTPPKWTENYELWKFPALAYSLWRHFPYWCSLLSDCSSLCQIELKLVITQQRGTYILSGRKKLQRTVISIKRSADIWILHTLNHLYLKFLCLWKNLFQLTVLSNPRTQIW